MSPPAGNTHSMHCGGGEGREKKEIVHSYHYLHPLDVYFTLNLLIDTSDRNHVGRDQADISEFIFNTEQQQRREREMKSGLITYGSRWCRAIRACVRRRMIA